MIPESQCTDTVLMIRPAHFGYNEETALSNSFQSNDASNKHEIETKARFEFDQLVEVLKNNGIHVLVIEDTEYPVKPDAVFPNNWITTHADGTVITYPMYAKQRRAERREDIVTEVETRFQVKQRYSFDAFEEEDMILEGTGSMILDRENKIVYACLSARTDPALLDRFSLLRRYEKLVFNAVSPEGVAVYHTNVIMSVGENEVIICLECIQDEEEKKALLNAFHQSNKTIIELSWDQILHFAGNMLQLKNKSGQRYWVMSSSAYDSLSNDQIKLLSANSNIIYAPIPTIEKYGGGSVRCMLAEIFLIRR